MVSEMVNNRKTHTQETVNKMVAKIVYVSSGKPRGWTAKKVLAKYRSRPPLVLDICTGFNIL